jgi:hypothetical protein
MCAFRLVYLDRFLKGDEGVRVCVCEAYVQEGLYHL